MGPGTKGSAQPLDNEFDDEVEDIGLPPQRIGDQEEAGDVYDDEVVHEVGCDKDEDCTCQEDP